MPERSFLVDILLNQNQLLEAVLENRTSDPGSPVSGQAWFRTDLGKAKLYDGTEIRLLSTEEWVKGFSTYKQPVTVATAGTSIDLTTATDPSPIDGVTLADGDRVLLKDQTTASENGIYEAVTAIDPTTWVRAEDANEDKEVVTGLYTYVKEGTVSGTDAFILTTTESITLDTTDLTFEEFPTVVGPSKYAETIGDGAATTITVTHNFGTKDCQVAIRETASPYGEVEATVEYSTVDSVDLTFGSAPDTDEYRVTVTG